MEPHGGRKTELKICAEVVGRGKQRKQVACFKVVGNINGDILYVQYHW